MVQALPGNIYDNQELLMDISNTSLNLLVGADLKIISVYGGVGYSMSKTNLKLKGNYPIPDDNLVVDDLNPYEDPIDMDIKNNQLRLNAGLRIKMAVVTLHFDYTYADYSMATAGLGIAFR